MLVGTPQFSRGDSWTWTNLGTFSSHGWKLIFYHGVSDPWFSAKDTIDYYQRMSIDPHIVMIAVTVVR